MEWEASLALTLCFLCEETCLSSCYYLFFVCERFDVAKACGRTIRGTGRRGGEEGGSRCRAILFFPRGRGVETGRRGVRF